MTQFKKSFTSEKGPKTKTENSKKILQVKRLSRFLENQAMERHVSNDMYGVMH